MRAVTVEIKMRILVKLDEGRSVEEFIEDLDYEVSPPDYANIDDTEILDYEVKDSR